jgi:enoyl-CoA hydratase/carnithine racemase
LIVEFVHREVRGDSPVATDILDRPTKLNAITLTMMSEMLKGDLSRDDALGLVAAVGGPSWSEHRDTHIEQFN